MASKIFLRRKAVFKALWPGKCYHKWISDGNMNAEKCSYCKGRRFATLGKSADSPDLTDPKGMGKILKRLRDFPKFFGVVFSPILANRKRIKAFICWDELDEMATPYAGIADTESIALFEAVEKLIKKESLL